MKKPTDTEIVDTNTNATTEAAAKTFAVVHIALKYARIETSLTAYQLFHGQQKLEQGPKIDTEIQTKVSPIKDNRHEVSLTLLLTGKTQQGQSIFQIKLEQTGIFELKGFTAEEENLLLHGHALSQIHPYASARVNELLIHAGYPPINMSPIDFAGLYQQQQAKMAAQPDSDKTILEASSVVQ